MITKLAKLTLKKRRNLHLNIRLNISRHHHKLIRISKTQCNIFAQSLTRNLLWNRKIRTIMMAKIAMRGFTFRVKIRLEVYFKII